jgi:hypothetical protein
MPSPTLSGKLTRKSVSPSEITLLFLLIAKLLLKRKLAGPVPVLLSHQLLLHQPINVEQMRNNVKQLPVALLLKLVIARMLNRRDASRMITIPASTRSRLEKSTSLDSNIKRQT